MPWSISVEEKSGRYDLVVREDCVHAGHSWRSYVPQKEEKLLLDKSKEFSASIDNHLLTAYTRIRNKVKNGLAVVSIERGASGGSFFTIPPQIQLEIANRKKITIDEHSGRILIDADLAAEEKEKIDSLFA